MDSRSSIDVLLQEIMKWTLSASTVLFFKTYFYSASSSCIATRAGPFKMVIPSRLFHCYSLSSITLPSCLLLTRIRSLVVLGLRWYPCQVSNHPRKQVPQIATHDNPSIKIEFSIHRSKLWFSHRWVWNREAVKP